MIIADDFKPEAESAKPYMLRTSATKASRSRTANARSFRRNEEMMEHPQ